MRIARNMHHKDTYLCLKQTPISHLCPAGNTTALVCVCLPGRAPGGNTRHSRVRCVSSFFFFSSCFGAKFFLRPDFGLRPSSQSIKNKKEDLEIIDFLLWKWKGKLSMEWYPFLFGLKHDLQIKQKLLTSERLIKSQTIPLSEFLNKGELK